MPRAKYDDAIAWIAYNDEPTDMDLLTVADLISVQLVADVWGKTPDRVAQDVLNIRNKEQR